MATKYRTPTEVRELMASENYRPNFRERFEQWHLAKYGYVMVPKQPFTAMNMHYTHTTQQARWETYQEFAK